MGRLVLVRHGQASYGQADYDRLSPTGEQQARALGPTLAGLGLDALFVGPLRRQQQTAAFARETAELPVPTTRSYHECLSEGHVAEASFCLQCGARLPPYQRQARASQAAPNSAA